MIKHLKGKKTLNLLITAIVLSTSSCISTKKVAYFQNASVAQKSIIDSVTKFTEPIIQTDDILSVDIKTIDPQSVAVVNQASEMLVGGSSANRGSETIAGFLVDKNGDIELSQVGKIRVVGLTTYEAKELIREKVSKDFRNPTVSVRFANFKISVLGEVTRPAAYTVPNEKVSVLDVLSLAGDLTIYGKRENILVIRDKDGKKELGRLDLNSSAIFSSPFFYLKQNDVIYVEPNKAKVLTLNSATRTTIAVALSAISTVILIITRL